MRANEPLKRLTSDDGLLAKLVENQVVNDADAFRIDQAMRAEQLSDTEYSYFRLRGGITQALGGPLPPTIHTNKVAIYPGDRILLCTDGIHDNLIDEEIEHILRTGARTTAARLLIEHSIRRSHEERDITGLPVQSTARLGILRTFQQSRIYREMTILDNVRISLPSHHLTLSHMLMPPPAHASASSSECATLLPSPT